MNGYEVAVILVIVAVMVLLGWATARWAPIDTWAAGVRSVTEYAERLVRERRKKA